MLEELVPFNPIGFFTFQADAQYQKGRREIPLLKSHRLPDLSAFHGESSFAKVAFGWNERGIFVTAHVEKPLQKICFPDFQSGDSLELFFDTRDVKTAGFTTRFCHHFFFLPEPIETNEESIQAGEVTRFRTEDVHELCDASALFVSCERGRRHYQLHVFIPAESLHGYDPSQFNRLGFTYRINRFEETPQCFSVSSEDFNIEKHPALWASLLLKDKK